MQLNPRSRDYTQNGTICRQISDSPTYHIVQTVHEDVFIWSVKPERSVNPPLSALQKSSNLSTCLKWAA